MEKLVFFVTNPQPKSRKGLERYTEKLENYMFQYRGKYIQLDQTCEIFHEFEKGYFSALHRSAKLTMGITADEDARYTNFMHFFTKLVEKI